MISSTIDLFLSLAETDLVLPLVRKNPSCLTVKNDAGVTARQLLQDFKDRMKLRCRQRHHHPEVLDCVVDCQVFVVLLYQLYNFWQIITAEIYR